MPCKQMITVAAAAATAVLLVSCGPQHVPEVVLVAEVVERISLPKRCEKFLRGKHGEWNPVTETYPVNKDWNQCMGVSRRAVQRP